MAFPFFSRREPPVIGSDAPDAFYVGRYINEHTRQVGPKMQLPGTEPIIVLGRNRSGKDSGIGTYNLLRLKGRSVFWFDPRLEAAAICAPYRRTLGPTYVVDALGIADTFPPGYEDLRSDGWGALARYRAADPKLFDHTSANSEAKIREDKQNPHFSLRARGGFTAAQMIEVIEAEQEGRTPLLSNARVKMTEGVEYDPATGEPTKGWIATARRWQSNGNPQVASLLGNFTEDNDEMRSVLATMDGGTQCDLSSAIINDEKKNGCPLHELGDYPMSVVFGLPHEAVQSDSMYAPYARLAISSALRSLYRPRPQGTVCTFWINEFTALGRLQAIESAIGLVAGYGIQIILVTQSLAALREIYSHGWEAFVGNAAALVLIGPPADKFTADYLAARSGEMTIRQPNVGMTLNPGGVGLSNGEAYTRRQYLMPMDLYGLQPGYGYVFVAGLSNAIPAYFPPYWDVDQLNKRARANPYYRG